MNTRTEKARNMIAKASLLGLEDSELKLLEHLLGASGSFHTKLVEAFQHADLWNKRRLVEAFPEILESINRYYTEDGYWEEFEHKYL